MAVSMVALSVVAVVPIVAGVLWRQFRGKRERKRQVLFDDLYFAEGPRWHAGHLYFSDFGTARVFAVDWGTKQRREVVAVEDAEDCCRGPSGIGWRPDGTMLVTQMRARRLLAFKPGGQRPDAAELGAFATGHCNDLVVDSSGGAYVGNFGFELEPVERAVRSGTPMDQVLPLIKSTCLTRVDPEGKVTAATPPELTFPNGVVITPDGKTLMVAETLGQRVSAYKRAADGSLSERWTWAELAPMALPDGMCLDSVGAVWVALAGKAMFIRVVAGGKIVEEIPATQGFTAVACILGGFDGRTLFMLEARTSDPEQVKAAGPGNSRIVTAVVDFPAATSPQASHYFAGYC